MRELGDCISTAIGLRFGQLRLECRTPEAIFLCSTAISVDRLGHRSSLTDVDSDFAGGDLCALVDEFIL